MGGAPAEPEDVDAPEAMSPTVSLRRVAEEIESLFEGSSAYLNRRTGEIVSVSHEHLRAAEEEEKDEDQRPEWERELIEDAKNVLSDGDFLELPDRFDVHEYEIMRIFGDSLDNEGLREEILSILQGSGAFRRFKDAVHRHGIEDDWLRFRLEAIEEIAREWLKENGIPFRP